MVDIGFGAPRDGRPDPRELERARPNEIEQEGFEDAPIAPEPSGKVAQSRRRAFENLELPEGAEEMAAAILTDLRESSPGPDEPIAVSTDFWQLTKWPTDRLLKLLEYMMQRGWIKLPDYDWRMQAIFHSLPTSVALSKSSYDAYTPARPAQPSLVVYGNAHLGIGDQIINGDVEHRYCAA